VNCCNCDNPNIRYLTTTLEGWWFGCNACGHTTLIEDEDLCESEDPLVLVSS